MFTPSRFAEVADKFNLCAAFLDAVKAGKALTESGKVDFRAFPRLIDSAYLYADAKCTRKVTMIEALLKIDGIPASEFAWRSNSRTGTERHEMAEHYTTLCVMYLRERFPQYSFESTAVYSAAPKRKEVSAEDLAALGL